MPNNQVSGSKPKNYFYMHYVVLKWCGVNINPPKTQTEKYLNYLYTIFLTIFVYFHFLAGEIFALLLEEFTVEDTTFLLTYVFTHILAVAKGLLIFALRGKIHNICVAMQFGIFCPNPERGGEQELKFVQDAIKLTNGQAWFFYMSLHFLVGSYMANEIMNNMRSEEVFVDPVTNENATRITNRLLYNAWYPFDTESRPMYELTCIYQVVCILVYGYMVGACDTMICSILCHLKAQLLILSNSFECIMERTEKMMKKDGIEIDLSVYSSSCFDNSNVQLLPGNIQKYLDICIRDCVDHYQQIIDVAQETETCFNYLLLIQFSASLLLICFQLFNLSLNVTELTSTGSLSMIVYCILATFQVFIFCWHGNEIMLISDKLSTTIFETNWYITSISCRKSLLLMMVRAFRPIKMTAGKFTFLSLETFVTVIRGAGSYFMVLRRMNE